jgi:hypothetical protein
MFFDLGLQDLLATGFVIGMSEFVAYFKRKERKKSLDIIGGKSDKLITFDSKKIRPFEYILYALGGTIIAASIWAGFKVGLIPEVFKTFSYGVMTIYLPFRLKNALTITVSEHGIVYNHLNILWKDLDRVEWDRDISQKLYGVKFYIKGKIIPVKIYVKRDYKEAFEKLINEYIR